MKLISKQTFFALFLFCSVTSLETQESRRTAAGSYESSGSQEALFFPKLPEREKVCPMRPIDIEVPSWETTQGRSEHFWHKETLFMLFFLMLSLVCSWNVVSIFRFLSGVRMKGKKCLSPHEITKLALSDSATGLCVFSLFMTSFTPILRALRKSWVPHITAFSVNEAFGMSLHELSMAKNAGGFAYKMSSVADYSWIGHAFFGLLWVFMGCIAIRTGASKRVLHRDYIGKLATVSLFFHFMFCCSNVYVDVAKHTFMNKVALLSTWASIFVHLAKAIAALKDKEATHQERVAAHMRQMFLVWIYSIEGSGQIRLVSTLFYSTGNIVTHFCKNRLYRFDSSVCAWKYLERNFFTRCVSYGYLFLYSLRNPSDEETRELLKRLVSTLPIEYLDLKFAEYFDAQYLTGGIQLVLIFKRLYDVAKIIKVAMSDEVQAFEEASSDEQVSDDVDFDQMVRSQLLHKQTSQSPGVLPFIRQFSLRAMGKAAKSFENLLPEVEDSDDELFEHPMAQLQSSVSAPLALMQSVSARAARSVRDNLQLVEEDSAFAPGLFSIVRSVTTRM